MKQSSRLLLSAAAVLPSVYGQMLVNQGTDQVCIDPIHTIVYEYPAYFSSVFQTAGTINNFFGGTNSLVISNVPQTVITSTVLTSTLTTTATRTRTVTEGASGTIAPGTPVTLGAGLPSGTVDAISAASPIKLAFIVDAVAGRRPKGYVSADGSASDEEAAPEFYLKDGELRTTDGRLIGRNKNETYSLIAPTDEPEEVTTTFSFVDGELQWNSPDRGPATFYECPDGLYAGFPDGPADCDKATIGGVTVDAISASKEEPVSTTSGSMSSSSASSGSSVSSMSNGSASRSSSMTGSSGSSANSGVSTSSNADSSSSTQSSSNASTSGSSSSSGTGTSSGTVSESGSSTASTSSLSGSSTLSESSSISSTTSGSATTSDDMSSSTDSSTTTSATPTASSDADICAAQEYQGYEVQCGHASSGAGDLATTREESLGDCIITCYITDGCLSVDYKIDGGFCYMHPNRADPNFITVDSTFDYAQQPEDTDGGDGGDTSSTTSSESSSATTIDAGESTTTSTISMTGTTTSGTTSSSTSSTTSSTSGSSSSTSSTTSGSSSSTTTTTTSASSSSTTTTTSGSSSSTTTTTGTIVSLTTTTTTSSTTTTTTTSTPSTTLTTTTTTTGSTSSKTTTTTTTSSSTTSTTTSTTSSTTSSTTTTTTSSTTTGAYVAPPTPNATPGVDTKPAPSGTQDGTKACTAQQCPKAANNPSFILNNGYYYAKWSGPSQGLVALNMITNNYANYKTFDECVADCNTRVTTGGSGYGLTIPAGQPCISVSWNYETGACYFHQQCRDTASTQQGVNDGVNEDQGYISAEKVPLSCGPLTE